MQDDGDEGDGVGPWEYSERAMHLVAAYQRKFPQLFARLSTAEFEREYSISQLFGPGDAGFTAIDRVRQWLSQLDTNGKPMVPVTTVAMPHAAVRAVERAAEARKLQLTKAPPKKVLVDGVSVESLFRKDSVSPTDVYWEASNSQPRIGDRVRNLSADTVPFGMRGTVISTHADSNCVEVAFDEDFMGGVTLHAVCSSRRGALLPWGSLLQLSGADAAAQAARIRSKFRTMQDMGLGKGGVKKVQRQKKNQKKKQQQQRQEQQRATQQQQLLQVLSAGGGKLSTGPTPAPAPAAPFVEGDEDEEKEEDGDSGDDDLADYWALLQSRAKAKKTGGARAGRQRPGAASKTRVQAQTKSKPKTPAQNRPQVKAPKDKSAMLTPDALSPVNAQAVEAAPRESHPRTI